MSKRKTEITEQQKSKASRQLTDASNGAGIELTEKELTRVSGGAKPMKWPE